MTNVMRRMYRALRRDILSGNPVIFKEITDSYDEFLQLNYDNVFPESDRKTDISSLINMIKKLLPVIKPNNTSLKNFVLLSTAYSDKFAQPYVVNFISNYIIEVLYMTREGDETPLEQLYANFYPQTTENENNQEIKANNDDEGDNSDPTAIPDLSNEDEKNNAAYIAARIFLEEMSALMKPAEGNNAPSEDKQEAIAPVAAPMPEKSSILGDKNYVQ